MSSSPPPPRSFAALRMTAGPLVECHPDRSEESERVVTLEIVATDYTDFHELKAALFLILLLFLLALIQ